LKVYNNFVNNEGYILYENISEQPVTVKCEYELENMISESRLREDVFKLDPNENKLLKIFRNGDGP